MEFVTTSIFFCATQIGLVRILRVFRAVCGAGWGANPMYNHISK
jgi:hypothetical protein